MSSVMYVAVASAVSRILRLRMVYREECPTGCELRVLHWARHFFLLLSFLRLKFYHELGG